MWQATAQVASMTDQAMTHWIHATQKRLEFLGNIMVWGCFSYQGVGKLVVLPKNIHMNRNNCMELVHDHLPNSFEKCRDEFMKDGAPCHTAFDEK